MRVAVRLLAMAAALSCASGQTLGAQEPARHHVFFEALGNGGTYSANYERAIGAVRLRAGFSNWSSSDWFGGGTTRFTTFPLSLSFLRGGGSHHLETGGGVTLGHQAFKSEFSASDNTSTQFVTLTGIFGYRYQKPSGGFVFRAVLTPMYGFGSEADAYPDQGFFPSLGLSYGVAF
jgi:hypothetical protein